MTNREVIKFIKSLKDDPEFGGGFDFKTSWERFAGEYGFEKDYSDFKITWRDYAEYLVHVGSKAALRPAGALASVFVAVLIGWVAAVNVSMASVQGDFMYPVKIATEKARLVLAATKEQQARLHAEFASRRLDEMIEIASSAREDKKMLVQETVDNFKQSIDAATATVESMVSASPEAAADIAMIIDQKVEAMSSVIFVGENTASFEGHGEQLAEAQNSTRVSNQLLTETIVTSNEAAKQERTEVYLQDTFKKDMAEIENRSSVLLVRVDRIKTAVAAGQESSFDFSKGLEVISETLAGFDSQLTEARDFFAAGGWRRVLETVTELKTKLSTAELLVTEMEIEISTGSDLGVEGP